jgi:hypothetical protein
MAVYDNRVCKECGKTFSGGPRAWYCPNCRAVRQREQNRKHKQKKPERPLGSIDICQNCGKPYRVASGLQKYCPDCQEEMHRKLDNEKSTRYYHNVVAATDEGMQKKHETAKKSRERSKEKIAETKREYYQDNKDVINSKRTCRAEKDRIIKVFEETHSIKKTTKLTVFSWNKVVKTLSTEGIIINETHQQIMDYYNAGKSPEEISVAMNMNVNVVKSYLPRSRPEQGTVKPSENSLRIRKCREKKKHKGENNEY